ncbi:hypothetical protein HOY82DRAFT_553334, partial [Tuber indicum]
MLWIVVLLACWGICVLRITSPLKYSGCLGNVVYLLPLSNTLFPFFLWLVLSSLSDRIRISSFSSHQAQPSRCRFQQSSINWGES